MYLEGLQGTCGFTLTILGRRVWAKAVTKEEVQQRQMESQWLADPILAKQMWGPNTTRGCTSLGTPSVSQPGERAGSSH